MTVASRLIKRALTPQQVWGADLDWQSGNTKAGVTVSTQSSLTEETVWACVTLLMDSISTMPVMVMRKEGNRRIPQPDPDWLRQPDPNLNVTRIDHLAAAVVSILTEGNIFTACFPSVFDPTFVDIVDPWKVRIEGREYKTRQSTFTPANMLHIPYLVMPGERRGIGPLHAARENIGLALAAQEFGSRYFGNGANIQGYVQAPADMNPVSRKQLIDSINERHQGVGKSHLLGILTGGATFKEATRSPKDSQMIELRKQQVESIARQFRIPPHKVGSQEPGAVGYASIEQREIDYVTAAVQPLVTKIELAYGRLLEPGQYLKFNLAALLRGDTTARFNAYAIALQNKWLTRDEVRAFEDLEPFGDERGGLLETPNNNPPAGRDEAGADVSPAPGEPDA